MAAIAAKPPEGLRRGHVPQEDGAVPADGGERGVVGRDADVEDFVAVGGVGLDELRWARRVERGCGGGRGGAGRVVEPDGAIRGAGEDVGGGRGGVGEGVDGAWMWIVVSHVSQSLGNVARRCSRLGGALRESRRSRGPWACLIRLGDHLLLLCDAVQCSAVPRRELFGYCGGKGSFARKNFCTHHLSLAAELMAWKGRPWSHLACEKGWAADQIVLSLLLLTSHRGIVRS